MCDDYAYKLLLLRGSVSLSVCVNYLRLLRDFAQT